MQSIPTLFSSSLTVFPDCLLNHTLGLYFICPLSGLASGCRRVSWMLSLVCCLQSLLQGLCFGSRTSYPLVLCHCSPHRPWQTSLSQEALEFNSGSPQLPYCTVKSSSITYLAMENWIFCHHCCVFLSSVITGFERVLLLQKVFIIWGKEENTLYSAVCPLSILILSLQNMLLLPRILCDELRCGRAALWPIFVSPQLL